MTAHTGPLAASHALRRAIVASTVEPVILYARWSPSVRVLQLGLPLASKAEAYGKQASSGTPRDCSSFSASAGHHPPQFTPWAPQKCRSASERSVGVSLLISSLDSRHPQL